MAFVLATATGFPPHRHSQEELIREFRGRWTKVFFNVDRLVQFHRSVLVGERYLALPIAEYHKLNGFGDHNDAWIRVATELGKATVTDVLARGRMGAADIRQLTTTTVTGIAVPSLDARLMNLLPFAPDTKRVPLFGLGCLAGAAGVARVADYLKGHPTEAAILLSVELCSLTLQADDLSIANIISSGLFGDGAAAVLMIGAEHERVADGLPRVVDSRSVFFPKTERVMGWDIVDSGFKIVLSPDVPAFATAIRPHVDGFLAEHGLAVSDIETWVAHPGGPKVIDAMEDALSLGRGALDISRRSLARIGNVSSSSILFILQETLIEPKRKGSYGCMIAMGPAFCAELVLLQW